MEDEKIKIQYKGMTITYRSLDDKTDAFHIEEENENRKEYSTLTKVMKAVDDSFKVEFEKKDVLVLTMGYREISSFTEGTATSITEEGDVWVTYKNPKSFTKRSKHTSSVFHDTPINREIFSKVQALEKRHNEEQKEYEKERKELLNQITCLTKRREY